MLGAVWGARGQGALVYDQQSANGYVPPNISMYIQPNEPMGQSFIPSLASVGFVQLEVGDSVTLNGIGATLHVNLLANSITGTVLASTAPVFMPDNFFGMTTFLFSTAVSLTPGTTYYFQPVVESGNHWVVNTLGSVYPRGSAFFNGTADLNNDFWFREGTVVPEPSASWLILIGGGVFFYVRRKDNKRCSHS